MLPVMGSDEHVVWWRGSVKGPTKIVHNSSKSPMNLDKRHVSFNNKRGMQYLRMLDVSARILDGGGSAVGPDR